MDDRIKLNLYRGIKSGAFDDRQKLNAYRAIKSNASNEEVSGLLKNVAFGNLQNKDSLSSLVDERTGRDRQNFDYDTGADGGLRSLISFGETSGDKEAILKRLVGKDGFTKDNQGRLALTPEGQKIRGMDVSDKNIIIDEEGFSGRDIADFAGIAPEAILGTIDSIMGGTAGSIVPFAGTMAGAAIGGGVGSAAGQAIEEAIESIFGVQTQTGREVAGDVAFEGALGASASIVGDLVYRAGRGIVGAGRKAVSGLKTPTQELSGKNLEQVSRIFDEGALPSLEAIGMPGSIPVMQKTYENITKDTTRQTANLNWALGKVQGFLEKYGLKPGVTADDIGREARDAASQNIKELKKIKEQAMKQASKDSITAVDRAANIIENASVGRLEINETAMQSIVDAFDSFRSVSKTKFDEVDNLLREIGQMNLDNPILVNGRTISAVEAKDARVINLQNLYATLDDYQYGLGAPRGYLDLKSGPFMLREEYIKAANALRNLEGSATFGQISGIRKGVQDEMWFNKDIRFKTDADLNVVKDALDDVLKNTKIDLVEGVGTQSQRAMMKKVSEARDRAMAHYREGLPRFEKLEKHAIIRSIRQTANEGGEFDVARFFSKVVRDDDPKRLESVLNAVKEDLIGPTYKPEILRSQLANYFIKENLLTKGIAKGINTSNFHTKLIDLKGTGPVLFGDNYKKVLKLAESMKDNGIKTMYDVKGAAKISDIEEALVNSLKTLDTESDKQLIISLQNLHDTSIDLKRTLVDRVLKQITNDPDRVTEEGVIRALTQNGLSVQEVNTMKGFFKNQPEVFEDIKRSTFNQIINSVDAEVFDSLKNAKLLKETLKAYDSKGALNAMLGKEAADGIRQFADDLIVLGDVGKEGSISAAAITINPIANAYKIIRAKIFSWLFANRKFMEKYLQTRKKLTNPEEISEHVTSALNEGATNLPQIRAILQGTFQASKVAGEATRQTVPRAIIQDNRDKPAKRSMTPLPKVPDFDANIFNLPTQQPTRTAPLSPIEQIRQNALRKRSLRDRAAQNPSVAASLLGGLGSASLLKS